MKINFEHGKWDSFFGYQCDQCLLIMPYMEGAISHEMATDENGGKCPVAEEKRGPTNDPE